MIALVGVDGVEARRDQQRRVCGQRVGTEDEECAARIGDGFGAKVFAGEGADEAIGGEQRSHRSAVSRACVSLNPRGRFGLPGATAASHCTEDFVRQNAQIGQRGRTNMLVDH